MYKYIYILPIILFIIGSNLLSVQQSLAQDDVSSGEQLLVEEEVQRILQDYETFGTFTETNRYVSEEYITKFKELFATDEISILNDLSKPELNDNSLELEAYTLEATKWFPEGLTFRLSDKNINTAIKRSDGTVIVKVDMLKKLEGFTNDGNYLTEQMHEISMAIWLDSGIKNGKIVLIESFKDNLDEMGIDYSALVEEDAVAEVVESSKKGKKAKGKKAKKASKEDEEDIMDLPDLADLGKKAKGKKAKKASKEDEEDTMGLPDLADLGKKAPKPPKIKAPKVKKPKMPKMPKVPKVTDFPAIGESGEDDEEKESVIQVPRSTGNDTEGLHLGLFVGADPFSSLSSNFSQLEAVEGLEKFDLKQNTALSYGGRVEAAYFFTPNIGIGLSIGYHAYQNSVSFDSLSIRTQVRDADNDDATLSTLWKSVDETSSFPLVGAGLHIHYKQLLTDVIGIYGSIGGHYDFLALNPAIKVTDNVAQKNYIYNYDDINYGSGTDELYAIDALNEDEAIFLDKYNIYDTDIQGLSNEDLGINNAITAVARIGAFFQLSDNMAVRGGGVLRWGINDLYNGTAVKPDSWVEVEQNEGTTTVNNNYQPITSQSDNIAIRAIGLEIGVLMNF